jgi:PKD repeat protein
MKNLSVLCMMISVMTILTACQKVPEASFTVESETVAVNLPVEFTNTSLDAETYNWDFGDGTTSTEVSPTHTFTSLGVYSVTLSATSKNGKKSDIAMVAVTVTTLANVLPVASFTYSPATVYIGTTVTFTDHTTHTPTSWLWKFGDGSTSTLQNPTHAYTAVGSYSVILAASNAFGTSKDTVVILVVNPLDYLLGSYMVNDSSAYGIFDYSDVITQVPGYNDRIRVTKFGYYINGVVYFVVSGYNVYVPLQTVNCGSPAQNHTFSGSGVINPSGPVIVINYTDSTSSLTVDCREVYVHD